MKKLSLYIESESLEKELQSYKMLEKLFHIISINMVFSYQNLDEDVQKAINSGAIQTIEKMKMLKISAIMVVFIIKFLNSKAF